MSSFVKAQKSGQRLHRERVNVLANGFLERKKDYQTRAAEYNRRKAIFTKLRKKVLEKNPDEFFFHMKSSHLVDGVHYDIRKDDDELQPEELQLMQSQDLNYVNFKHTIDMKKVLKLQSELHWLDHDPNKPKNKHTFFVEDRKEKRKFNIPKRMQMNEESWKSDSHFKSSTRKISEKDLQLSNEVKELKYRKLRNKIQREKFLRTVATKMRLKKQLLNKKEYAKKVCKGSANKPPVFEWKMERKK